MGAKQGNDNAKKKMRTRVSACLSIADARLLWALEEMREKGELEPTDAKVAEFVRGQCYEMIDEVMRRKAANREKTT